MSQSSDPYATAPLGERPRFYIFGPDFEFNPSDFAFVNEDAALIGGRMSGIHSHRWGKLSMNVGIPPLREKPRLVVGADRDECLDIYGFGPWYVSSRAKALLVDIDPDGFEFAECITVNGSGIPIEPYWMLDVVRVFDQFDAARSSVVRYADRFPDAPDASSNQALVALNDVHFGHGVARNHAFYLIQYSTSFIFGETLVDAWRDAGLIGAECTPLQPPSALELARCDHFVNYPYWGRKGW